jgi:hypothetical protein
MGWNLWNRDKKKNQTKKSMKQNAGFLKNKQDWQTPGKSD